MIFMTRDDQHAQPGTLSKSQRDHGCISTLAACGFTDTGLQAPPLNAEFAAFGVFDYMFPETDTIADEITTEAELDLLAAAVASQADQPLAELPEIYHHIGRFIDHDISAAATRKAAPMGLGSDSAPLPRPEVSTTLANLRSGALHLDSLYGGATVQGSFADRIRAALRFPPDPAKLMVGPCTETASSGPDLFRLDMALHRRPPVLTGSDFENLPDDLRQEFFDETGAFRGERALIADQRNDACPALARFHLTMAAFHNATVDMAPAGDAETRFGWTRRQLRWTYQWLLIHDYLAQICDPQVLAHTLYNNAPVYDYFYYDLASTTNLNGTLPVPLEFTAAAFQVAPQPRPKTGLDQTSYRQMFHPPTQARPPQARARLHPTSQGGTPEAGAWAQGLAGRFGLADHAPGTARATGHLRRGHLLNLPSAQACLEGLSRRGVNLPFLTNAELRSGPADAVLSDAFLDQTPLWFYLHQESLMRAGGRHLGPLGSRIVAETLIGLVRHSPDSYWHQPGRDHGRWHPDDGNQPGGAPIRRFQDLAEAAGMI